LLVRKDKVGKALEWLKLNHDDYADLNISYENLNEYPENGPPVVVDYRVSEGQKDPEAMAAHNDNGEDGTRSGPCSFAVQGLTRQDLGNKFWKPLIAIALKHITKGKPITSGRT
jgi:hypothetical protein